MARHNHIAGNLRQLGLSRRAYNALARAGIADIAHLETLTTEQLLKIRNLGMVSLVEIRNKLAEYRAASLPSPVTTEPLLPEPSGSGSEATSGFKADGADEPDGDTASSSTAEIPVAAQLPLDWPAPTPSAANEPSSTSLFHDLNDREREALELRYGLRDGRAHKLDAIGQQWGLSRERVRQIAGKALNELQRQSTWRTWCDQFQNLLAGLGGLATDAEVEAGVKTLAAEANVHSLGLARLLAELDDEKVGLETVAGQTLWKLKAIWNPDHFYYVYDLARDIMSELGACAPDELIRAFRSRPDYPATLTLEFARAVLRVHPGLVHRADGVLSVKRRGRPARSESEQDRPELAISPEAAEASTEIGEPIPEPTEAEAEPEPEAEQLSWPDVAEDYPELATWEESLRPQIQRVGLVGEIRLTVEECVQLGGLIGRVLSERRGRSRALRFIEKYYPATFLVFLVAQGVHGYRGGDYWSGVGQRLGIELDANWHGLMGQLMERLLATYGLPLFPEMRAHAARYLSLILAHGGIPTYCLGDYFQNVVKPAVHQRLAGQSAEARLADLLQRSAVRFVTDRPVAYFLENGGNVAVDFFQRSCDLAQEWQATEAVPLPEAVGLPEHVVAFFQGWAPDNLRQAARERESADRLHPPALHIDPWGEGLLLRLPAQPISALADMPAVAWTIEELDKTIPTRVSFGKTNEINVPLRQPRERYVVSLRIAERMWEWTVEGYSPDQPLMIFDPQTGRWQSRLTPTELWLYRPRTHTLEVLEGEGRLAEELPALSADWLGQGWDLSEAHVLGLKDPAQAMKRLLVRSAEQARPILIGEPRWPAPASGGRPDVFVGALPQVRIPLTPGRGAEAGELERWQITIRALDEATVMPVRLTLSALDPAALYPHDHGVDVLLEHPALLGPQPIGLFSIKVSGPIGRDATFTLGCVPVFECVGLDELLLPDSHVGPPPVRGEIWLMESDQLELTGESRAAQLRQIRLGVNQIEIPGHLARLELMITRVMEDGVERSVSFTLPLRRAQWRLAGSELEDSGWSGRPLRLLLNRLFQQPETALLVDLPGVDPEAIQLSLRLINVEGEIRQVEPVLRHHRAPYWRCELARFHDTLRTMRSPVLRFELECLGLPGVDGLQHLPVLDLTRELDVEHIHSSWQKTERGHQLRVTWTERTSLRSRVLYVWSVWRPWEAPLKLDIPDDVQGVYEAFLPLEQVPPGYYRLSLAIVDPWRVVELPTLSPHGSPGTVDLPLTDIQSRLAELEASSDLTQACACNLERAYIRHVSGLPQGDLSDLAWCGRHLELAGARHLVALCRLLNASSSLDLLTDFANRLFEPDQIQRLLQYYSEGQINASEFEELTQTAPQLAQWPVETCTALTDAPEPRLRLAALRQLAARDSSQAVPRLLRSVAEAKLSEDEFVQLLSADKYAALDALAGQPPSPLLRRLVKLLEGQSILVRPGMWLECNVGYGQIKRIEDIENKTSVDQFFEDDGIYRLHIALHLAIDSDLQGESAIVDMRSRQITFPRAKNIYVCPHCGFVSTKLPLYKAHVFYGCPAPPFTPPQPGNALSLTRLKFFNRPARHI